jgi:deoxyadenosine/deoxycytidine kinase
MENKLVSLVGNIGAGKTTFGKKIKELISEEVDVFTQNIDGYEKLIELYYGDKSSFTSVFQIFSITRKMVNIYDATESKKPVVFIERYLSDNREIFARKQYEDGFESEKAWIEYSKFYSMVKDIVRVPDLYIYFKADPKFLLDRIQNQRKRKGEEVITLEYLSDIDRRYEKWIKGKGRYFEVNITKNLSDNNILYIYACIKAWFNIPNLVCSKCSSEKIKLKLNFSEAESVNLVPTVECNECGNLTTDNFFKLIGGK